MNAEEMYIKMKAKLDRIVPDVELRYKAEIAVEINELKLQRNAVILGHNYMEPALLQFHPGLHRRFAGSKPQGCPDRQGYHRLLRCQVHGRNRQDPEPDQDRAPARRPGGMLPG